MILKWFGANSQLFIFLDKNSLCLNIPSPVKITFSPFSFNISASSLKSKDVQSSNFTSLLSIFL